MKEAESLGACFILIKVKKSVDKIPLFDEKFFYGKLNCWDIKFPSYANNGIIYFSLEI